MAQRNTIIGTIAGIRVHDNNDWVLCEAVTGMGEGTKVFLSIVDRYWSKTKQCFDTRLIPFQGFVPEGATLSKGQFIAADFIVNPYIDQDGYTSIAFDIVNWDFSLCMGNGGARVDPDRGMRVAGGQFNDNADNSTDSSTDNYMDNNVQGQAADDGFRNIPDGIDEELPFN